MNKEVISSALEKVKYPGFSRDIVSFGLVQGVAFENGVASVSIEVTNADPTVPTQIKKSIEDTLAQVDGIDEVQVAVVVKKSSAPAPSPEKAMPASDTLSQVDHIVAVASGKGGVGKSTFAVNLACSFEQLMGGSGGVGLMDCDIYGPSIPLMIGINGRPEIEDSNLHPLENFGIRVMSMGFLIDEDTPVVWRGPMVTKTITQFVSNVNWGELEFLLVDLPPGTGDAQLTIVQTMPLDGAIIITTPQIAAFNVARRGATMFGKVNVPILGVVENMSFLHQQVITSRNLLPNRLTDFLHCRQMLIIIESPWPPELDRHANRAVVKLLALCSNGKGIRHEELWDVAFVVLIHLQRSIKPTLARADRSLRLDQD